MPVKRLCVAAALVLAACAQNPWTKQGATGEELRADQRACELAATQEVQRRQSRSASTMGPAVVGGQTGSESRRTNTTPQGPFADQRGTQLSEEDRLIAECMRGRGYERVTRK
jgi:hypothetical protein